MEAFQNILDTSPSPAKLFQLQVCSVEDGNQVQPNYDHKISKDVHENPASFSSLHTHDNSHVWTSESTNFYGDTSNDTSVCMSDSSGYGSVEEFSSPEFNTENEVPCKLTSPNCYPEKWSSTYQGYSGSCNSLPEVTPECIYNVPALPDIPPLRLTFDDVDGGHDPEANGVSSGTYTSYMLANPMFENLYFSICNPVSSC